LTTKQIIQRKFKSLIKIIEKQRPGAFAKYYNGPSSEEMGALLPDRNIPDELVAIYSCFDRVNASLPEKHSFLDELRPSFSLIPMNEISKIILNLERLAREYPEADFWQPDMIPFMRNESSDYFIVRTFEDDKSIWLIFHDNEPLYYFQNMGLFLDFMVECYKKKAYYLDEDGFPYTNFDLEDEIKERYSAN
jgi:hypothetical protein